MPRASFSHSVELTRPSSEVWVALQDAATWSGIGPVDDVWEPSHAADGTLESFQWSAHVGPTKYKGTAVVAVADGPRHMKLDLDSSEVKGSLVADIDGDSSPSLAVTLEVVSKGAMASLFFPIISEAIGRGLPEQVERFAELINRDVPPGADTPRLEPL